MDAAITIADAIMDTTEKSSLLRLDATMSQIVYHKYWAVIEAPPFVQMGVSTNISYYTGISV